MDGAARTVVAVFQEAWMLGAGDKNVRSCMRAKPGRGV